MESNDTKFAHSESIMVSQDSKSYGYTVFGKVKHWFSPFDSNPNSTGHPIQLQIKTVHVEWSLMILNFPTLSPFWFFYYVFDIAYPKQCLNTLLFFERFMFGIVTGPKVSKTLVGVIRDIQKIK